MKYFNNITDLEQAKLYYRKLAKLLHPDTGGTAVDFQQMQQEYKELLLHFQQKQNVVSSPIQSDKSELLSELGKLAKVLIKKQVPQNYLRHKIQTTESPLKRGFFSNIVEFLDRL